MNRKIRTYPPVIVAVLVMLALTVAAVASISAEAERQAATQPQEGIQTAIMQAQLVASLAPEDTPEVTLGPEPTYTSAVKSRDWDGEDSRKLLKLAMAEAEGESVEGKALVMLVVLNRVWDDRFPDTIERVILQKNQFSPVAEGGRYWTTEPDAGCYEALEMVLGGWDESQGALYFEGTGKDGWHSQNLELLFEYGGHKFYR